MAYRPLHVQTQNDEGQFVTVKDGTHDGMHTAYWHYVEVCEQPGVHLLLRGTHILLRSDTVELAADQPADSLL